MIGISMGLGLGARAVGPTGPVILLTASSISEAAVSGSTVGVLSVANGTGTYTFTETADPDSKFAVSGANLNTAAALDFATASSHSVTISATNGVDDPIVRTFTITVLEDVAAPLDFIFGGQSNALFHRDRSNSPPTAHPDTQMWDNVNGGWIAPAGNGLINLCNDLQAATGRTVRVVVWGQSGTPIALFRKDAATFTLYADLIARLTASGVTPAYSLWHQGENDIGGLRDQAYYNAQLDGLHGELCADLGITRADMPWVVSSLGPAIGTPSADEFESAIQIQRALANINDFFPNIHYSHSNQDATLIDTIHWDGASYGRSGKRYAQTVLVLEGQESNKPAWFATDAERLTTTTTRVDLVHSMGTDFTPSTGITGFEVSNNNGASWASASAARLDADSITLTHTDLGTVERLVRYQPGTWSDVSVPAKDNGTLNSPLNYTPSPLAAPGAVSLPIVTSQAGAVAENGASSSTTHAISGATEDLFCVIGVASPNLNGPSVVSVTCSPSGSVITPTTVVSNISGGPAGGLFSLTLPSGTTSIQVNVTYEATTNGRSSISVRTIKLASLNSTTPVATNSANDGSNTASAISTTVNTVADGVLLVTAINRDSRALVSLAGDEVFTNNSVDAALVTSVEGSVSGTAANTPSTATYTVSGTARLLILAASWR